MMKETRQPEQRLNNEQTAVITNVSPAIGNTDVGCSLSLSDVNKMSEKEMFESLADDYIALNFKGQHYTSVIQFVEVMLERLKLNQSKSDIPTIRDVLGREIKSQGQIAKELLSTPITLGNKIRY